MRTEGWSKISARAPRVRKTTVLVVEDDPELRTLYHGAIRAAGYAVVAVEDGLDALRRIEQHVPDIVVLDLELPRLRGRDVYRELTGNAKTAKIPIVVVTGSSLSDDDQREFSCVLQKPVHGRP